MKLSDFLILETLVENKVLDSYDIVCDETNNNEESISQNKIFVDLVPKRSLQDIQIYFKIGHE